MIKGLSETRRPSRGGKLRLGEKRAGKGGKDYPAATAHFVFDPVDPAMTPVFAGIYGETPTELVVEFASDDPEEVFPQWYKCYGASGLLCRGDGERAGRVVDGGEVEDVPCPGPEACPFAAERGFGGRPGCKAIGCLQVVLPEMPVLQVWQMDTGSIHSIININSALALLQGATGGLAGRKVKLVRRTQRVTVDGKAKDVYVVDVQIPYSLDAIRAGAGTGTGGFLALESTPAVVEDVAPDDLYPEPQIASLGKGEQAARKADYDEAVGITCSAYVADRLKERGCTNLRYTPPKVMAEVLDQIRTDTARREGDPTQVLDGVDL